MPERRGSSQGRASRRSTHPHACQDGERLKGKFRFRALVRKVIINMTWLAEAPQEEAEGAEGDERKWERAMLRAKSRRRREGAHLFTLEEKVLFNKPAYARTEKELEKAYTVIKRIKAFENFSEEVQRGLSETLYFVFLGENRVILKEGQEPQAVYFILQGDVLISLAKTDPYTSTPYSEQVAMLTTGDMFGEVALLQDIMRTATCTTASVVELLGLHRDDFAAVLQQTLAAQWARFREELARFSYFDGWTETQLREACILGRLRAFAKDETVLGDGCGTVEYAYFLLNGTCRLVQTLTVEVWEEFGDTVYRLLDDPTLVAVRQLPEERPRGPAGGRPSHAESRSSMTPSELAVQDEWNMAAMKLDAAIGLDAQSPRWRAARAEVERILKKDEPFKYKSIVHQEAWDEARRHVLQTLGDHSSRAPHSSESTAAVQRLFGRGPGGAAAARVSRLSALPGVSGRYAQLPAFVGRPGSFLRPVGSAAQDGARSSRGESTRASAVHDLAHRASMVGVGLPALSAEAPARSRDRQKPLQLELVRGHHEHASARHGSSTSHSSAASARTARVRSILAFASDAERQDTVKMRHAFEDPFIRTPRPRRLSLVSRGSIRSAWVAGVRAVLACLDLCEEAGGADDDAEELRECWRRARQSVERLMKKEQTPLLQPHHRISTHFVQVCFYTPLQVFGIGECMDQRRVTAMSATECLLLPRYWIDQNNVGNVWERVRLYLNRQIPDSRAVFRAWAGERRWLRHRTQLVSELINKRRIHSGTTPHDVPYFLRLQEVSRPHELGYERRFVIRPKGVSAPVRKTTRLHPAMGNL